MKIGRCILSFLAIGVLCQGCSLGRTTLGEDIKPEAITAIHRGATTKTDVLTLLGAPDRLFPLNGREVFQYYRYDAKMGGLLLIVLNLGRVSIKSDDLFVILNREGIVEEVMSAQRTNKLEFRFWPFGD